MKPLTPMIQSILLMSLTLTTAYAAQTNYAIGNSAGSELNIGLGPRAVAMGGAFVGLADDATSLAWNPAGLAQVACNQLGFMHDIYVQDIAMEYGTFAARLTPTSGIGLNVLYVDYGAIDKLEDNGGIPVLTGSFRPWALSVSAGYGKWIIPGVALGGAVKLFQQDLDGNQYSSVALDIGLLFQPGVKGLQVGANFQNLGTSIGEAPLATNLKFGADYVLPIKFGKNDNWHIVLDTNMPIEDVNYTSFNMGTEYLIDRSLALRLGYKVGEKGDLGDDTGLSAGLGWNMTIYDAVGMQFDYAFLVLGELGDSHQIGMTVKWGTCTQSGQQVQQEKPEKQVVVQVIEDKEASREARRLAALQRKQLIKQKALQQELDELKRKIGVGEFKPIAFTSGSSDLLPGSFPAMNYIGRVLSKYPDLKVRIEGHTDSQGDHDYNQKLSQARMESAQKYLVKKFKFESGRLIPIGYGESRPVADNATVEGRAKNRRVEFFVVTPGEEN